MRTPAVVAAALLLAGMAAAAEPLDLTDCARVITNPYLDVDFLSRGTNGYFAAHEASRSATFQCTPAALARLRAQLDLRSASSPAAVVVSSLRCEDGELFTCSHEGTCAEAQALSIPSGDVITLPVAKSQCTSPNSTEMLDASLEMYRIVEGMPFNLIRLRMGLSLYSDRDFERHPHKYASPRNQDADRLDAPADLPLWGAFEKVYARPHACPSTDRIYLSLAGKPVRVESDELICKATGEIFTADRKIAFHPVSNVEVTVDTTEISHFYWKFVANVAGSYLLAHRTQ